MHCAVDDEAGLVDRGLAAIDEVSVEIDLDEVSRFPSRSILTRFDAVISSNASPNRLIRNCSPAPGTRAEMCV
jgi:hypothetical protein